MIGLKKMFGVASVFYILILLMAPVSAKSATLQITGSNLYILNGFPGYAYSNGSTGMLLWSWGQSLNASYERSLSTYYTQHADNNGSFWGECVSSCKALSGSYVGTGDWSKGSLVVNGGVSAGTVVATFFGSGGGYGGHAAIFKGYIRDGQGNITGFNVWDQNWYYIDLNGNGQTDGGEGVFGTHPIYRNSGAVTTNANNYYVVNVP